MELTENLRVNKWLLSVKTAEQMETLPRGNDTFWYIFGAWKSWRYIQGGYPTIYLVLDYVKNKSPYMNKKLALFERDCAFGNILVVCGEHTFVKINNRLRSAIIVQDWSVVQRIKKGPELKF